MPEPQAKPVIVVTGLPRSGTSMMMRMLAAAGIPALVDEHRPPDDDNPLGYFEFEPVKATRTDNSWVARATGRAVKVVHLLLRELPPQFSYRVILMRRDLDEVLESQRKMLARSGKPGGTIAPDALKRTFTAQLDGIIRWVTDQPNFELLSVEYREVVSDPRAQAARVSAFLAIPENAAALDQMAAAVDASLYRNRA
jgi:hypothetical protein